MLTIKQAAPVLGVSENQTLSLIHSKQLPAVNVATNPLGRPSWRIEPAAISAFKAARSNRESAKLKKRAAVAAVVEYV